MTGKALAAALLLLAALAPPASLSAQEAGIEQLAWLVGEWRFEDEEINGEYRETGTRVCEWALGGEYISCESQGVDHRGRERSYLWYFNYNDVEERFEITSLFQGFPHKTLYTAVAHDEGHRLKISFGTWRGDQIVIDRGATVTYNGSDQYVWGNDRFRDVVTRR